MRTLLPALVCAVVLALSACSSEEAEPVAEPVSSASSVASPKPESSPTPEPSQEADPLADAVVTLGCTGWAQSPELAPFVDAWGTCDLDGTRLQVYLIPDDANYASFMESVAGFGITEAHVVRAGAVVVAPDDQTKVEQIRQAMG